MIWPSQNAIGGHFAKFKENMPLVDMIDQIKKLIELQGLDAEIFRLKRVLEAYPEKVKEFDDVLKEKEGALKQVEEDLKNLQVQRKDKEVDLQTKEETAKKQQSQLYQLKSNKEYQAMLKEIEGTKADISVCEEEVIGLLDDIGTLERKVAEEKNKFGQEKQEIGAEKKKLEEKKSQATQELNKLNTQRENFAKDVDKNVLARYERILHNKGGMALARIDGDSCSGCNMNLPPQVINETRMRKELVFCGNCARILYTQE